MKKDALNIKEKLKTPSPKKAQKIEKKLNFSPIEIYNSHVEDYIIDEKDKNEYSSQFFNYIEEEDKHFRELLLQHQKDEELFKNELEAFNEYEKKNANMNDLIYNNYQGVGNLGILYKNYEDILKKLKFKDDNDFINRFEKGRSSTVVGVLKNISTLEKEIKGFQKNPEKFVKNLLLYDRYVGFAKDVIYLNNKYNLFIKPIADNYDNIGKKDIIQIFSNSIPKDIFISAKTLDKLKHLNEKTREIFKLRNHINRVSPNKEKNILQTNN